MRIVFVLLLGLSVLLAPVSGLRAQQANRFDAAYLEAVKSTYAVPANFDFAAIRDLYAKTSYYKPDVLDPEVIFSQFIARQREGDPAVNAEVARFMLYHFALPQMHTQASAFFKDSDPRRAAYHDWASRGLTRALYRGADALSQETAVKVLIVQEEYTLASRFGNVEWQKSVVREGVNYDVLAVRKSDNALVELWFDTSYLQHAAAPY